VPYFLIKIIEKGRCAIQHSSLCSVLSWALGTTLVKSLHSVNALTHTPREAVAKAGYFSEVGFIVLSFVIAGYLLRLLLKKFFNHRKITELSQPNYRKQGQKNIPGNLPEALQKCKNLMVVTDGSGIIEWVNNSDQSQSHYTTDNIETFIGKNIAEISHNSKIIECVEKAIRTKSILEFKTKGFDKNRREYWIGTVLHPLLNQDGKVENLLFVDSDISENFDHKIPPQEDLKQNGTLEAPILRLGKDATLLYANESAENILKSWNADLNKVVPKVNVQIKVQHSISSGIREHLTIECNSRLVLLSFIPTNNREYIDVYGEDITESKSSVNSANRSLFTQGKSSADNQDKASTGGKSALLTEEAVRKYFKDSFLLNTTNPGEGSNLVIIHEVESGSFILIQINARHSHLSKSLLSLSVKDRAGQVAAHHPAASPDAILQMVHRELANMFRTKAPQMLRETLNISVLKINNGNSELQFAGTRQTLYRVNGQLNIYDGNQDITAGLDFLEESTLTTHDIKIASGDAIYLANDSVFNDSCGATDNQIMKEKFEQLLFHNHKYSMQVQSEIYKKTLADWNIKFKQISHLSILGIKF
jgi:hypothetical protein